MIINKVQSAYSVRGVGGITGSVVTLVRKPFTLTLVVSLESAVNPMHVFGV